MDGLGRTPGFSPESIAPPHQNKSVSPGKVEEKINNIAEQSLIHPDASEKEDKSLPLRGRVTHQTAHESTIRDKEGLKDLLPLTNSIFSTRREITLAKLDLPPEVEPSTLYSPPTFGGKFFDKDELEQAHLEQGETPENSAVLENSEKESIASEESEGQEKTLQEEVEVETHLLDSSKVEQHQGDPQPASPATPNEGDSRPTSLKKASSPTKSSSSQSSSRKEKASSLTKSSSSQSSSRKEKASSPTKSSSQSSSRKEKASSKSSSSKSSSPTKNASSSPKNDNTDKKVSKLRHLLSSKMDILEKSQETQTKNVKKLENKVTQQIKANNNLISRNIDLTKKLERSLRSISKLQTTILSEKSKTSKTPPPSKKPKVTEKSKLDLTTKTTKTETIDTKAIDAEKFKAEKKSQINAEVENLLKVNFETTPGAKLKHFKYKIIELIKPHMENPSEMKILMGLINEIDLSTETKRTDKKQLSRNASLRTSDDNVSIRVNASLVFETQKFLNNLKGKF